MKPLLLLFVLAAFISVIFLDFRFKPSDAENIQALHSEIDSLKRRIKYLDVKYMALDSLLNYLEGDSCEK